MSKRCRQNRGVDAGNDFLAERSASGLAGAEKNDRTASMSYPLWPGEASRLSRGTSIIARPVPDGDLALMRGSTNLHLD